MNGEKKRRSLPPILLDITVATMSSLTAAVSVLVVTKIITTAFTQEEFGNYATARSIALALVPIATGCLQIAVTRYASSEGERRKVQTAAAQLFVVSSLITVFVFVFVSGCFQQSMADYVVGMAVLLLGHASLRLYTSIARTNYKAIYSSLVLAFFLGVVPIVCALLFLNVSTAAILFSTGLFTCLCFFPISKMAINKIVDSRDSYATLIKYSAPRVPAGFFRAGIFTVCVAAPGIAGSPTVAANVALALYLFRLIEVLLGGFSNVALHRTAYAYSAKGEEFIESTTRLIVSFTMYCGLFATFQLLILSPLFITAWVGKNYSEASIALQLISLVTIPYLLFVLLRSVIDAVEEKAPNTTYLGISFIVACLGAVAAFALDGGEVAFASTFIASITCLGALNLRYFVKSFGLSIDPGDTIRAALLNSLVAICSISIVEFLPKLGLTNHVAVIAITGLGSGFVFLTGLVIVKPIWFENIITRVQQLTPTSN
ncbi:MAG: hypothetical protein JJ956_15330 [Pseudomonadales bacterium]|nr:hypothetical protein [Pseudomonadales bacterium]